MFRCLMPGAHGARASYSIATGMKPVRVMHSMMPENAGRKHSGPDNARAISVGATIGCCTEAEKGGEYHQGHLVS